MVVLQLLIQIALIIILLSYLFIAFVFYCFLELLVFVYSHVVLDLLLKPRILHNLLLIIHIITVLIFGVLMHLVSLFAKIVLEVEKLLIPPRTIIL